VGEAVGRTDLLEQARGADHWKAHGVDLEPLLVRPPGGMPEREPLVARQPKRIDAAMIAALGSLPATIELRVGNDDRTVGAAASGELVRRMGGERPTGDGLTVKLTGSAGQSLGAFLVEGITVEVSGDANDYAGKGLSGGRIIIRQPASAPRVSSDNIIVGNTCLYGATAGEAYFNGMAGERFAVRNSGATAVVEGIGDHGCEYMTGGIVVVLGKVGRNFAAGMSGGIALVYDPDGSFEKQCNMASVGLGPVEDPAQLKALVEAHHAHTGSSRAKELLGGWDRALGKFLLVMPTDYRRALEALSAQQDLAA
jgi:glutamate synthase (NADPH/NADH) large chain